MAYTIGVVCSLGVGPNRGGRSRNEDNYLVCQDGKVQYLDGEREVRQLGGGEGVLVAVADGMGGHEDGHIASTTATRVVAKLYKPGVPRDPAKALLKYIQDAHQRLYWKARDRGPVTMGTTLSVCWLLDGTCAWAQVGDSRIYLFRQGQLRRLSADQTMNEYARRDGRPERPDGETLAQSFIFGSRGIGDNTRLRLEPGRDADQVSLQKGDRIVLCSDGLSGSVDDASIADVLRNTPEPQAAAVAMMERAVARGSTDNITVLVVRVDEVPLLGESVEAWDDEGDETVTF
ncbi:MAG: serine/threonine-protein phosphatase [Alphaproteobacteria bacterium]|nr:serine/threonine-protein phosphatase [Alphaproteobacteria bacterium]MCB9692825.1 serine/threonine-protein phosphatase [Alphaproteobacteria bacterium]